ncbi:hypothetical protein ACEPUD_16460 [Burkholderia ubonensis]|uniref:hypothetical protein n=1 Tax=Burkholderia ubonensis TaxID=101571 RepID=UPI0012F75EED|nr:hypothetical protein [Burkholderia ubonensis]
MDKYEIGRRIAREHCPTANEPVAARLQRAMSPEQRKHASVSPAMSLRAGSLIRTYGPVCPGMVFGEHQCRVRVDNAAQSFAILRRICLNLLKAGASDVCCTAVLRL